MRKKIKQLNSMSIRVMDNGFTLESHWKEGWEDSTENEIYPSMGALVAGIKGKYSQSQELKDEAEENGN